MSDNEVPDIDHQQYKLLGPDYNPKPKDLLEDDYFSSFINEMLDEIEIYEIVEEAKKGEVSWANTYLYVAYIYSRLFLQDEYLKLYIEKAKECGHPKADEILKDNKINKDVLNKLYDVRV